MSASTGDKVTDTRNAARPNSARVTSGRSAGGATLACDNLSGWPTASKVHFVTYKVDSNSAVVAGSQLDCYGIVSGNNIGSFTVVDGNDSGHAVGDYVEMLPTAAWGQDLADALTTGHTRTGAHVASLPLTTPILTTPTITDFTSATHSHANNAGGGQLGFSALLSTIFSGQIVVSTNAGTGGGDTNFLNLGGLKICWGLTASSSAVSTNGVQNLGVTFPTTFAAAPKVFATNTDIANDNRLGLNVVGTTTTATTIAIASFAAGATATSKAAWIAIGT